MMYPYPKIYPNEAVQIICDYLMGNDDAVQKKDAIHASWVVSGFSLSKIFGGGPEVIGTKKFRVTKAPATAEKRKAFFATLAKANRYGTFKKLEEENPSCWHHLYDLSKEINK
jgi:hypothetical protein